MKKMKKELKNVAASLTPKQQAFIDEKTLEGTFHPSKLLKLLIKVARYDKVNDDLRNEYKKRAFTGFVIAFLGIFLSFFVTSLLHPYVMYTYFAAIAFALTLAIVFTVKNRKLNKTNLHNNVRDFVFPLTAVLQEEVRPDCRFKISLLGDQPRAEEYLVKTIPRKGRLGREYEIYHHPWLKGSLPLHDGIHLSFSFMKQLTVINVRKRSASGKTKHKTKLKTKEVALIKIQAPKTVYRIDSASDAVKRHPIRVNETADAILVKTKMVRKAATLPESDLHSFLHAIQTLYSTIKPITS